MRGSQVSETDDELRKNQTVHARLSKHEQSLQEERSLNPERFSSPPQTRRGPSVPLSGSPTSMPEVNVREIKVRQVSTDIAQLRASLGSTAAPQTTEPVPGPAGDEPAAMPQRMQESALKQYGLVWNGDHWSKAS